MKYNIAQILGFIAFIISLTSYHRKKKKDILSSMILSNILNLIHYFLLNAYSGCTTKILAIIRDGFIILKEKNKKLSKNIFLISFIIVYFIAGIITYDKIFSVFPILAAIIYIIPIWNGNEKTVKKAAFLCYFLWLVYNIFVFSVAGIISNIIAIISVLLAIIKENNINIRKKSNNFSSTKK